MGAGRKYRRQAHQGGVLFVLPVIPDDAPPTFKHGLALRNEASLAGRCRCGAVGRQEASPVPGVIGRVVFEHEDHCAAVLDPATTLPVVARPLDLTTSWQTVYRPPRPRETKPSQQQSRLTPATLKRKWPKLAAKLDAALDLLAPADPATCPHQTDFPLLICLQHPTAGGICRNCMPGHLQTGHTRPDGRPIQAETTCDQCGAVDDHIIPVLATIARDTILAIGLGLCNRCYDNDKAAAS